MSLFRRLTGRNGAPARQFGGKRRAVPMLLALEPRYMFDAAGAGTVAENHGEAPPPPADAATEPALKPLAPDVRSDAADFQTDIAGPGFHEIRAADPALTNGRKEVVFIESNVAGRQALTDAVKPGTAVVILDAGGDGLAQMAAWAQTHSGYDAVHIVSHGAEGQINLGALTLDADAALNRPADLATLGAALNPGGDLLLYGCSVASGQGEGFIAVMAARTGADVAASDDLTGAAALGGNWTLERTVGAVETAEISAASFGYVLANTYTVTVGDNTSDNLSAGADLAADQADGGGLSLWEALHYAADGDTIAFNLSSGTGVAMNSQSMAVKAGLVFDADAMASLTISGGTLSLAGELTVSNGSSDALTISSIIANGTGTGALIKTGDGRLALSGANTYTGTTLITAGSLSITADNNLGSGALTLNGGQLTLAGFSGPLDNAITLGSSGGTINVSSSAATISGLISGSGALTKTGGQSLTLSNTGNSAAAATLVVQAGGVIVASDSALIGGAVTLNGGGLAITGAVTIDNNITLVGSSNTITDGGGATLSGIISGSGGFTKAGGQLLTLSGANTYTGTTTVSAGPMLINHATALGSADGETIVSSGATLRIGAGLTVAENFTISGGGYSSYGAIKVNGGDATVTGDVTLAADADLGAYNASDTLTISGVISGAFNLGKVQAGTVVLSGANTYTGTTTVTTGTLVAANDAALGTSAAGTTVTSGAALGFKDGVTIADAVTAAGTGVSNSGAIYNVGGTNTLSGAVTLNAATTFRVNAGGLTISGAVSGAFGLTKTGTETLTLSGANTYTGATSVSAGTLIAAHNTALGTTAGATTVTAGAALGFKGGVTVAEAVTASGTGVSNSGAIYNVSDANTLSGNVTLGAATIFGVNAGGLTVSGNVGGAYALTKTGAETLTLSGANSAGFTTLAVSAGALGITADAALGSGALTLAAGTTLQITGATTVNNNITLSGSATIQADAAATVSGVISGVGFGLTKSGSATLTLTGDNTYTGATTVSAGGLTLDRSGGALADASAVTVLNGGVLTLSHDETVGSIAGAGSIALGANRLTTGEANTSTTFSGAISGSGALRHSGTGTLTLSGANSDQTWSMQLWSGAISIADATNIGTGTLNLNGGTLTITGGDVAFAHDILTDGVGATVSNANAVTLSGVISGSEFFTKAGAGTLTLSGASTYSGSTTVSAGTLSVTGALGGTSAVSVQDGATLGGTGSIFAVSSANMLTVLNGGTLTPGVAGTAGGVGKLTVNGDLRLSGGFAVDIAGSGGVAGTDYDQVAVSGAVQLNGGTLTISRAAGHTTAGYAYTLIDNDDADPVGGAGAFADAAEGVYFTSGGYSYAVSYVGGSGNDVVLNDNAAPTFASTAVTAATSGEAYRYVVVTSDAENDAVTVTSTTLPGWLTFVGGVLSGTPGTAEIGTHNVVLTATDAIGNATTQSFTITVSAAVTPTPPVAPTNSAPVFTSSPATAAVEDAAYAYAVATTDPNGDAVTVTATSLPSWLTFANGVLSGTPTQANVGTHTVTLTATDAKGAQTIQSFAITVVEINDAPVFTSTPSAVAVAGTVYAYIPAASDEEGQTVTYAATSLPAWLTFSGGALSGTPGATDIGAHRVVLTATDAAGNTTTQSFMISVSAAANNPPVFTSTPATTVNEKTGYSYTPTATDDGGQTLTFAATALPSWLTFSGGVLSGTPGQGDVGAHTVTLTATDAAGAVTVQTFTVTVADVNDAPVFASGQPGAATAGQPFSFSLAASDPEGGQLRFSAASLPAWLKLTDNGNGSATLSGTPGASDIGAVSVTVSATDSGGAVTTQTLSFSVASDATLNINQTSTSATTSATSSSATITSSSTMTSPSASNGSGAGGSNAVSLAPSGGAAAGSDGGGAASSSTRVGGVEGNTSSSTSIQQNQGLTSTATTSDASASGDASTFVRNAARGDSAATSAYYGAATYLSLANLGGGSVSGGGLGGGSAFERGQTTTPLDSGRNPSNPAPTQERETGPQGPEPQGERPQGERPQDQSPAPPQGQEQEQGQGQDPGGNEGQGQPAERPQNETRANGRDDGTAVTGFNAQLAAIQSAFDTRVDRLSAAAKAMRSAA